MSEKKRREYRKRAADELKSARKKKSPASRQQHTTTARAYKVLAENEAWLQGGSPKRPPRKPAGKNR